MYDENIDKAQYHKYLHWIRRMYCSGRLIQDHQWQVLSDMAYTMDKLTRRSNWLKKQSKLDHFLGDEVEEFVVLTDSYNKLLQVTIDIEDFLKFKTGDEESAFKTEEEALAGIDKVYEEIAKIKSDNEEYFNKEL